MTLLRLERDTSLSSSDYICNGGYDEAEPDSFHLEYPPHSESVAMEIVKAAAFVHNLDHTELTPLVEDIDPEALDSVVGPQATDPDTEVELTFTYEELEIAVNNSGDIWLQWD